MDPTSLVDLISIATNQANRNESTDKYIKKLLKYCATHTDVTIGYKEIDMLLHIVFWGANF